MSLVCCAQIQIKLVKELKIYQGKIARLYRSETVF